MYIKKIVIETRKLVARLHTFDIKSLVIFYQSYIITIKVVLRGGHPPGALSNIYILVQAQNVINF